MLKRIIQASLVLLSLVAYGQNGVGNWRVHPYYVGSQIKNIIDTGDCIYYLVGSYLYCLDTTTDENQSYNKSNYLNDVNVTGIYYNYDSHYLVVTYANSNIDIIDDNGNVSNVSDIKDATMTPLRGINDVTFAGGMIYVSTQFGYVVIDEQKLVVHQSRIYGQDISSMAVMGQWMVMSHDGELLASSTSSHNDNFGAFEAIDETLPRNPHASLLAVNGNTLIVNGDNGVQVLSLVPDDTGAPTVAGSTPVTSCRAAAVQPTPSGYVISELSSDSCYHTLDAAGANPSRVSAGYEIYSANPKGDGTLWALSAQGVHKNGDTQNYYKPDGIGIQVSAFYMAFSEGQGRLYVTSSSDNLLAEWGSVLGTTTQIFAYDGYHWTDVTPSNLPGNGVSSNWQMVVDPFDNNTYVYPSRKYGVVKVTNDKIVIVYDETNSLFRSGYYKGACAFDAAGNLWVVYSSASASTDDARNVAVLPRAKYEQSQVSASDWVTVSVPGTKQQYFKGSNLVVAGDVLVYNSGGYQKPFAFWTQPDGLNSTPRRANYTTLTDQDGKSISWNNVYSMVADHNGIVWAGFNNGIISFDPSQAFNDNFTINHIKVPRNDGTGLADYLLDGSQINCIAVDGANRKWIGTDNSGLFLVSADGSEVLRQFTTDNSYLSTNTIYSVCCNPTNNSVYVVTANDFLEYFSDTTPGSTSYSNVHVYPNPVHPDYMGSVTIVGLMDNSLVKIADSGGHVIKQLKSTGGMATWDCVGDNGERVSTGVYYILASEKEGGSTHATVAKFVVVK